MIKAGDLIQFGNTQGLVFNRSLLKRTLLVAVPRAGEAIIVDYVTISSRSARLIMKSRELLRQHYPWWCCNDRGESSQLNDAWEDAGTALPDKPVLARG